MAWNGSSGKDGSKAKPSTKTKARKPSPLRGIVAGALVVVLAAAAYFTFFSGDKPKVERPATPKGAPAKIAEVKPAPAPTNKVQEVVSYVNKMRDHDELTVAQLRKLPLWQRSERDNMRVDPTFSNRLERFRREQAAIPWATIVDRELAMLLFPKNNNLGLLIPFDHRFKDRFLKSLSTPTLVLESDSEELKQQKRELNEVKARLKAEIDRGGDVVQILNDEYNAIKKIGGLQDSLQRELRNFAKTAETYEDVEDFVQAANVMLKEQGGKEMKIPLDVKLRFGRHIRKESNQ